MKGRRKKKKLRSYLTGLIVICVLITVVFLYGSKQGWWLFSNEIKHIDNNNLTDTVKSSFPIEYGMYNNVFAYNGLMVRYDNDLEWIDDKGEMLEKSEEDIKDPMFKSCGQYLAVAETKGRMVRLFSDKVELWSANVEGDILNVDVNANGYVAVVMNYTGYKSAVEVFDVKGKPCLLSAKESGKIINACVMEDNKQIVLNITDISGGSIESTIEYMDMSGKTLSSVKTQNEIMYKVRALSGYKSVAAGANQVVVSGSSGKDTVRKKYSNIIGMEKINDDFFAVAAIPSMEDSKNAGTIIEVIDKNGNTKSRFELATTIRTITAGYSTIAVQSGKKLTILNLSGDIIGGCDLSREIMGVHYMSKSSVLVTLSDKGIICNY